MKNLAAALIVALMACGGSSTKTNTTKTNTDTGPAVVTAPPKPKSLAERLGGKQAVVAVVDQFVTNIAADGRINQRFYNVDMVKLKGLLVDFVCQAGGGGCEYKGQTMETSHAGMDLVHDEFAALVEDLVAALDKFKVGDTEKGELLGALGPLEPAIVTPADRLKPVTGADLDKVKKFASKVTDPTAAPIYAAAVVALERGQRNYADQLFSRIEFITSAKAVASVAGIFRAGGPPRITTAVTKMPMDTPAQPAMVGSSDEDSPDAKPGGASLTGHITVGGKPLEGLGTIQLYPAKGGKRRTAKTRVVEQRDKTFAPHVLAVPTGSTVQFPNFDGVYHNVFSISSTKKFDVGLYKDGDSRSVKFDKPGIVRLGCNIHAKMAAYVVVVDAPHYIVVDGANEFKFSSLAPGKYKVRVWSEKSAAPIDSELDVNPGENSIDFDVKADAESGPSEDKFGMARGPAKP